MCGVIMHYLSLHAFTTHTHTHTQARGIDIPLLDNVINYNFPAKSKLFVHRVGKPHTMVDQHIALSIAPVLTNNFIFSFRSCCESWKEWRSLLPHLQ
jgi:hypothetical protein